MQLPSEDEEEGLGAPSKNGSEKDHSQRREGDKSSSQDDNTDTTSSSSDLDTDDDDDDSSEEEIVVRRYGSSTIEVTPIRRSKRDSLDLRRKSPKDYSDPFYSSRKGRRGKSFDFRSGKSPKNLYGSESSSTYVRKKKRASMVNTAPADDDDGDPFEGFNGNVPRHARSLDIKRPAKSLDLKRSEAPSPYLQRSMRVFPARTPSGILLSGPQFTPGITPSLRIKLGEITNPNILLLE